jgi:hypothetical protein
MNRNFMLIAGAGLMLAAGSALGQAGTGSSSQAPPPVPGTSGAPGATGEGSVTLETLDTNRDGKLSPSEAASSSELTAQFVVLDRNRDSQLDSAEFARFEIGGSAVAPEPNEKR